VQKDLSGESSDVLKEPDEKKPKIEQNTGSNLRGKQTSKQAKDPEGDRPQIAIALQKGYFLRSCILLLKGPCYAISLKG